jgi:phosphoesterase RecJ-like protein
LIESAADILAREESFLLTGHEHPDGDCLGSQAALYHLLKSMGKQVVIRNPDPIIRVYDFLLEHTPIESGLPLPEHDVTVLLDCSQLSRVGRLASAIQERAAKLLVIDHHVDSFDGDESEHFIDPSAPATGALVYRLYKHFGLPISPAAAEGIFLSLISDTGWFRYSNTDSEVLRIATEMVSEGGVVPVRIFDLINRRNDPNSVSLLTTCLSKSEVMLGGRLGVVALDRVLVEEAANIALALDQVIEPLRSVDGIEVVALLKERLDGGVKLSLRATGDVDVQKIAQSFGGGGHKKAAGASLSEAIDAAKSIVIDRIQSVLEAS